MLLQVQITYRAPTSAAAPAKAVRTGCGASGDVFDHVAPWRWAEGPVPRVSSTPRRPPHATAVIGHPRIPVRPPAPRTYFGAGEPIVRRVGQQIVGPVIAFLRSRWIDHARDVPRRAEHEAQVAADQARRLVRGAPGDDVVFARRIDVARKRDAR